jgi:uncharacterized membrane protein
MTLMVTMTMMATMMAVRLMVAQSKLKQYLNHLYPYINAHFVCMDI